MWVNYRKNQGVRKPSKATSSTRMATRFTHQHCWYFKTEIALISQNPVTVLDLKNILHSYKWRRGLFRFLKLIQKIRDTHRHSSLGPHGSLASSHPTKSRSRRQSGCRSSWSALCWPETLRNKPWWECSQWSAPRQSLCPGLRCDWTAKHIEGTRQKVTTCISGNSHRIQGNKNP